MSPLSAPVKLIHSCEGFVRTVRELSRYPLGVEPEIAMRDLHQKLSVWEKLYHRWEHREPHPDSSGTGASRASDHQMCAMEVELRAMNAKADTSFEAAVAALRRFDRPKG